MKAFWPLLWLAGCQGMTFAPMSPGGDRTRDEARTCRFAPPAVTCPYVRTHPYLPLPSGRGYYWFDVDEVPDAEAVGPVMCCNPTVLQSVWPWGSVATAVVGPDASGATCTIEFATTDQHRAGLQPGMKRCEVPIPWERPLEWLYTREVPVNFADLPTDCEDISSSAAITEAVTITPDQIPHDTGCPTCGAP